MDITLLKQEGEVAFQQHKYFTHQAQALLELSRIQLGLNSRYGFHRAPLTFERRRENLSEAERCRGRLESIARRIALLSF